MVISTPTTHRPVASLALIFTVVRHLRSVSMSFISYIADWIAAQLIEVRIHLVLSLRQGGKLDCSSFVNGAVAFVPRNDVRNLGLSSTETYQ